MALVVTVGIVSASAAAAISNDDDNSASLNEEFNSPNSSSLTVINANVARQLYEPGYTPAPRTQVEGIAVQS